MADFEGQVVDPEFSDQRCHDVGARVAELVDEVGRLAHGYDARIREDLAQRDVVERVLRIPGCDAEGGGRGRGGVRSGRHERAFLE